MATKAQTERALELREDRLSSLPEVVGLGIVPIEQRRRSGGEYAVAVYVKKLPKSKKARSLFPSVLRIPGRKHRVDVPVQLIEQGQVSLEEETFELE